VRFREYLASDAAQDYFANGNNEVAVVPPQPPATPRSPRWAVSDDNLNIGASAGIRRLPSASSFALGFM